MNQPIQMKAINTEKAPKAIGPYSQAIEANVKEQTRQSLTNARNVLQAAGADLSNVVKTTVFLSDMANFAEMNEVYAEFFSQPFPARSAVAVKALPKGALVEVECIAAK